MEESLSRQRCDAYVTLTAFFSAVGWIFFFSLESQSRQLSASTDESSAVVVIRGYPGWHFYDRFEWKNDDVKNNSDFCQRKCPQKMISMYVCYLFREMSHSHSI